MSLEVVGMKNAMNGEFDVDFNMTRANDDNAIVQFLDHQP